MILTVIPRGLQGLGPEGGIGVLGYPSLHMTHHSTSVPIHHHGTHSTTTSMYTVGGITVCYEACL